MFEHSDRYLGLSCLIVGMIGYITAAQWRVVMSTDPAGPGAVPKILCIGLVIIGIILAAGSFLMTKNIKRDEKKAFFSKDNLIILQLTAICIAYLIILPVIGYLLATPLLIAGILLSMRIREAKKIVLVSLIGMLVLFLVFYVVLKVNLPLGFTRRLISGFGLIR